MAHPYWQPAIDAALADCLPDLAPPTAEQLREMEKWVTEEEAQTFGCPVLGHDCAEARCQRQCRMSAFSWAEMDADRERNAR